MQKKYSKAEALKIIKRIYRNGITIPTGHLKEQMFKKDFDIHDVLCAIENGIIYDEPEIHIRTGELTYRVQGERIDGGKLTVVIQISEEDDSIIILTGIPK